MAALILTLLFLFLLVTASQKIGTRLTDLSLYRFETKLIYIIVFSLALGALLMFGLMSFLAARPVHLPARNSTSSAPTAAPVREVETALQLGDLEKADKLLGEISPADADYWLARKIAGDLAAEREEWGNAESMYQESLRLAPEEDKPLVLFCLANLQERQGLGDRSQDLYKEVLRMNPQASEAGFQLRFHAMQDQNWIEALRWQEHLEEHCPKVITGPLEEETRIGIRFELAQAQYQEGDYKTSQALMKYVLRMTDSFAPAYLITGEIQEKLGNLSAAVRSWERGFQATGSPVLLRRIGEYFLTQNVPETAIEFFRNAIQNHREEPSLEFLLGDLYQRLEMVEEALKVFERIDQRYPDWFLNRVALARLYQRTGRPEMASRLYQDLLESGEIVSVLLWQCRNCTMTYHEYQSFCVECFHWDSIALNQSKAGNKDFMYGKSTASPL